MQIGNGGASRVFRGVLPTGKELAVKLLEKSEHVLKDFASEVDILSDLRHESIISLEIIQHSLVASPIYK